MNQGTLALLGADLTKVPGPSLSMLATQAELLLRENDLNPLDEDSLFRTDFLKHLDGAVLEDCKRRLSTLLTRAAQMSTT